MNPKILKIGVSGIAVILALVHLILPNLNIDAITVTFILIAIVPWLAPLFKSLELPGGWKVEFRDLEKARTRADRAGLLSEVPDSTLSDYSFQTIAEKDPNLALAGLRIEIEKRLVALAKRSDIHVYRANVSKLLRQLGEKQRLTQEESSVLSDLISLLNSPVHGASVDKRAVDWALDVDPRLLLNLESKIDSWHNSV